MMKYAKICNEETKQVLVGLGDNAQFYQSQGFELMEVEQAYNGAWYVYGFAPEKPDKEKKAAVRAVRDEYINGIEWRVSRYRDQTELGIATTDDEETYHKILQYMQYLREYPESSDDWYEHEPMTFEEYQQHN